MSSSTTKKKWNQKSAREVDVPRGAYLGWGTKPGQQVTAEVKRYTPTGGTDFNGDACPNLELLLLEPADSFNKSGERTTFEAGETIQLNVGQVSLKRAVTSAELEPGDLIQASLVNITKTSAGRTVKEFSLSVIPAEEAASDGSSFEDEADEDSDEPDF
jgi:hypothetical protein